MLEQNIGAAKKQFGMDVYDAMVAGDRSRTESLFNAAKSKVSGGVS